MTIGDEVVVQLNQISGDRCKLMIQAPREMTILRGEVLERTGGARPDCVIDGPHRHRQMVFWNRSKSQTLAAVRELLREIDYFRRNGGRGRIAAVTSVAGTKGIGSMAAYSASKRCAQTYMQALEQLARQEGVEVEFTDIRPGWIDTPLLTPGTSHALEMTPQYAVPRIIRALAGHRRVAVIDWRWRIVVALWRLLPSWLWVRMRVKINI